MNTSRYQITIGLGAILAMLATTGCKTVVRENIISSVETGIGVTLAENPKTELYEVKVGYIRSQFYSIPTGKTVENEDAKGKGSKTAKNQQDMRSNRADITPELVSGIKMSTSAKHLFLGADVAENFAVGKTAVMSPAAVAMYISQAENPDAARSAALSVAAAEPIAAMKIKAQARQAEAITNYVTASDGNLDKDKLNQLAKGTAWEQIITTEADNLSLDALKKRLDEDWSTMLDDLSKNLPK